MVRGWAGGFSFFFGKRKRNLALDGAEEEKTKSVALFEG